MADEMIDMSAKGQVSAFRCVSDEFKFEKLLTEDKLHQEYHIL